MVHLELQLWGEKAKKESADVTRQLFPSKQNNSQNYIVKKCEK
jgi:hypothetical protein